MPNEFDQMERSDHRIQQIIIFNMDSSSFYCRRLSLRIQKCTLREATAPASYSFSLSPPNQPSSFSSWKEPVGLVINFHCFLKSTLRDFRQTIKCVLRLYSRSNQQQIEVGHASLTVSEDRCGKVRKYSIRGKSGVVATVEASIFLKPLDSSQTSITWRSSQMAVHSDYSTIGKQPFSLSAESFIEEFKQNPESIIHKDQLRIRQTTMGIEKQMQVTINNKFEAQDAQKLLIKLFQQYGKQGAAIERKQVYLSEREADIEHIKMKELIIRKDEKKIRRLKKQTSFLLAANEVLNSKDQKYDEEYEQMKIEKQEMENKMKEIKVSTEAKIQSLKANLQAARKNLGGRQKKVKNLLQQLKVYGREIQVLKDNNKQKARLINKIKIQLNNEQARVQADQVDILGLLANMISPQGSQDNEKDNTTQPSQQRLHRYKSASLFKAGRREQSKLKMGKQQSSIKLPSIVSYLLNLNQQ